MANDVATRNDLLQNGTTTQIPGDTNAGPDPVVFFDNFFSDGGGAPADDFNSFVQWNVTGGSVDLVGGTGLGIFGAPPNQPNGRFVDLGGSTGDPGLFGTSGPLSVVAGQTYNLTFNYRSTTGDLDAATVTVGDRTFGVSSASTSFTRFSQDFTADQTGPITISFQGDEADRDNSGLGVDGLLFGPASDVASGTGNAAPPTIAGTRAGQTTSAETPVTPFSGVTLADPDPEATDTLIIALSGGGGTLAGAGLVDNGNGTYTFASDTPATLTAELRALAFTPANATPGASATTIFTLVDQSGAGSSAIDAATSVTDTAVADTASIDPLVRFADGAFTITGRVGSVAGITGVVISALVDGVQTNLGSATLGGDGSFTFTDTIGATGQSFITATATDGAGGTVAAQAGFSLQGGLGGRPFVAEQDAFNADGSALTATALFRADGSRRVTVEASGQTLSSAFFDTFVNGKQPDNTFVFDPGHGLDEVSGFRVGGTDHDTVSLLGSDFGNSVAEVLRNTQNGGGGAVITDPTSGDTVRLAGITKAQLSHNRGDFEFHG